jgi:tRNA(Ile)-lysidine synthase
MLAVAAGCEVTAYHVDHGLREGSAEEAEIVAQAAERLGAQMVSLKVRCEAGPNLEARAREARFAVLPAHCATGHTADDQAETILLNMLRGSGIDGLSGMRPGSRHPILALRRSETADLVESAGLSYVKDPSNDDPSFVRNRVRHELVPLLNDIARRDIVPLLCRQAGLLADEAGLLDELAATIEPTDARAIGASPVVLARRSLRRWLSSFREPGYPPSAQAVERVLSVARGEVRATEIDGGVRVWRSKGRLESDV